MTDGSSNHSSQGHKSFLLTNANFRWSSNYNTQTYGCPRDWRLPAWWWLNSGRVPWYGRGCDIPRGVSGDPSISGPKTQQSLGHLCAQLLHRVRRCYLLIANVDQIKMRQCIPMLMALERQSYTILQWHCRFLGKMSFSNSFGES